ncbi:hypothetical protein FOMPIDRAFT_1045943 [Fomitopsis schrenkii]|uniref:Uncharacterized protein n=1 Tax=Fomitopsis schrenkii TaxID=2126942 RepID=S8G329_FOMSC|nr:hypothetical protein FOMPIDRAFT_1045943 [Fomitopsis schrenkii]
MCQANLPLAVWQHGFHQLYRTPGPPDDPDSHDTHDDHDAPLNNNKNGFLHPDLLSGRNPYTLVGAGDIWDQSTEPFWRPWETRLDTDVYEVPVVTDAPVLSANAALHPPSAAVSQNTIVELFRRHAGARGRKVTVRYFSAEDAHRFVKDESMAPPEIAHHTAIPVDFIRGSGTFTGRRPPWECQ